MDSKTKKKEKLLTSKSANHHLDIHTLNLLMKHKLMDNMRRKILRFSKMLLNKQTLEKEYSELPLLMATEVAQQMLAKVSKM